MKGRRGQVALYLIMALLAVVVLMLLNVNAFLAVRSKNRMMNAVDEAAIAAAKYQGRLLNEVGRMNVEHLKAAVRGEAWVDEEGNDRMLEMRRMVFLDPIKCLKVANDAARDWGYSDGCESEALAGFFDHIAEIRNNPDLYTDGGSDAWGENLWQTYANALENALANCAVLPSFMEMINPGMSGIFASSGFYDVIAAKAWCWFTLGNNEQYLDMDPSQVEPAAIYPVEIPENSEVFSLHVTYGGWLDSDWADEYVQGVGFSERWTNFVCQVTGLESEDFAPNSTAADPTQVWAFYDKNWRKWSQTFSIEGGFPLAGSVKAEYDVAGCVSACMMIGHIPQLRKDDKTESVNTMLITAEAKPLGTVNDIDGGGAAPVTAYCNFIAPSRPGAQIFTEAQLVLVGSVPRSPGVSMEPNWYNHVKKHSPAHPSSASCGYCKLWAQWMQPSFRSGIRSWLNSNAESCKAKSSGDHEEYGGYEYAH